MSQVLIDFERGFVAASFLVGRRGDDLLSGLAAPTGSARALAAELAAPDRAARAQALAAELGRLVQGLEQRRIR